MMMFTLLFWFLFTPLATQFSASMPTLPSVTTDSSSTQQFHCDDLSGFVFDYPVPDGWHAFVRTDTLPGDSQTTQCALLWQNDTIKFYIAPTIAVDSSPVSTDMSQLTNVQTNPQGVQYVINRDLHTITFSKAGQTVIVNTYGVAIISDVQRQFERSVIETFRWTDVDSSL
jgi:hypothetical protein